MVFLQQRPNGVTDDQLEGAPALLARSQRLIALRGVIYGFHSRWDPYSPTMIGDTILAMNAVDEEKPIYLIIDSPGGEIDVGFMLYDVIRMSKAPVITIGMNCASMATVLLAAGKKRYVMAHSRIMMHLPSGGMQGTVDEVQIRADELRKSRDSLIAAYVECGVKKPHDEILAAIQKGEVWLDAKQTVEFGLADEILGSLSDIGFQRSVVGPSMVINPAQSGTSVGLPNVMRLGDMGMS